MLLFLKIININQKYQNYLEPFNFNIMYEMFPAVCYMKSNQLMIFNSCDSEIPSYNIKSNFLRKSKN